MACYMGQIVLSTLLFENLVDTSEQTVQEEWSGMARRRCVLCAVYCVLCTVYSFAGRRLPGQE